MAVMLEKPHPTIRVSATKQRVDRHAQRLYFIDNARIWLTVLVVAHHVGQAYGPTGGDWPIFEEERATLLGPFFTINAAFFMGLFFLIAGYCLPTAYDRKGTRRFLTDRLLRLGIPLLILGLGVFGPIAYLSTDTDLSFLQFFTQVYLGAGQVEVGHLWFVAHLLVYTLIYVAWRVLIHPARTREGNNQPSHLPNHRSILAYALALSVVTFIVRIWYPIDRWERAIPFLPAELAHLPQYASLVVIGVIANRQDWFDRLPRATGMVWLWIGVSLAALYYGYSLAEAWLPSITRTGGLEWRSLVWSTWEAFICVGLCIGLLTLLREWGNRQGRFLRLLAEQAYTVYIIHVFVVVGFQVSLVNLDLPPLTKFVLVTLASVPVCFLLSQIIRSLPGARRIL